MIADSQIYKTVQRSNTMTIILSLLGLGIVGVLAYLFFAPYWMANIGEAKVITAEEIIALDGSSPVYNRVIEGERMRDTYYYEETVDEDTGRQISIDAYFGALRIADDTWVLVREAEEIREREETYTGSLVPITDSIAIQVRDAASDEMRIDFLPVMLDTTRNEVPWYVGTGVLGVVGLASLWGVFAYVGRSSNPAKHPTLRRLSRFGDVEQVVDSIEKDTAMGEDKVGKLRLTRSWMINSGGTSFEAMPYHSVAWLYKMIVQGRYGKTYQAHFYDKTGVAIVIVDNENNVNAMLQAVGARAPWAVMGYNNDIKRSWDKDRVGFLTEVDRRKAQMQQQ